MLLRLLRILLLIINTRLKLFVVIVGGLDLRNLRLLRLWSLLLRLVVVHDKGLILLFILE